MTDWTLVVNEIKRWEARQRGSQLIVRAIVEALGPFRPKEVWLELQYSNDMLSQVLLISIPNFPDLDCKIDINRDLWSPEEIYLDVASKAFDIYRSIPRIDPPDNIDLGEE